jgi:hypothetical protein
MQWGSRVRGVFRAAFCLVLLAIAWAFFLYPAWATLRVIVTSEIRQTAQSPTLLEDYRSTARRYGDWAQEFLESQRAAKLNSEDVAGTEWPMFGSVFFLMTTEELVKVHPQLLKDAEVNRAVRLAAQVVASPDTATWVKVKWGLDYLTRENLFYRMLLVMGLSSHEQLLGSQQYRSLLESQAQSLTTELLAAAHHVADDYPGECYPNDVVWTVAALKRAARLGHVEMRDVYRLSDGLLATLNGPSMTESGLPAFSIEKHTAEPTQAARGSGNSGVIPLTAELNVEVAGDWFGAYVKNYWKHGWVSGFREMPFGSEGFEDVDSGPELFGVGSVATGFGLGAARSVGRFDHAVPLAMEIVPASWPTPFGLLLPGALGWAAADGWCFGELALQFSMTRPNLAERRVEFCGSIPPMVWVFLGIYLGGAALLIWWAWVHLRAVTLQPWSVMLQRSLEID